MLLASFESQIFGTRPSRSKWSTIVAQRAFFDELASKLALNINERSGVDGNVTDLSAWYSVSSQAVIDKGGKSILQRYGFSLSRTLMAIYPSFSWDPRKFLKVPQNYWSSLENQKSFMKELGKKLEIKEGDMEAWYKISGEDIIQHGGGPLLRKYKSISKLLSIIFPEVKWDEAKFKKVPQNYWDSLDNQRRFIVELARTLSYPEGDLTSFYKLNKQMVVDHGGAGLLAKYNQSISNLLVALYPDFPWDPLKFQKAPNSYWSSVENQRRFLTNLEEKLVIKSKEAWYKVSTRTLLENGGNGLLQQYNGSVQQMLSALYPDEAWDSRRFTKTFKNYWASMENQREYMDDLGRKLGFKAGDMEAYYSLTRKDLLENGGGGILKQYKGSLPNIVMKALRSSYPVVVCFPSHLFS